MSSDEAKLYNDFFFPNKFRKIALAKVKKQNQSDHCWLGIAASMQGGRMNHDHYLCRFDSGLNLKRQYEMQDIAMVDVNLSNASICIGFGNPHSIRGSLRSGEQEQRVFYFQNIPSCKEFSKELQKSIITIGNSQRCSLRGDLKTAEFQDQLIELSRRVSERGDRLREVQENSQRMMESAREFRQNATSLKNKYKGNGFY